MVKVLRLCVLLVLDNTCVYVTGVFTQFLI